MPKVEVISDKVFIGQTLILNLSQISAIYRTRDGDKFRLAVECAGQRAVSWGPYDTEEEVCNIIAAIKGQLRKQRSTPEAHPESELGDIIV